MSDTLQSNRLLWSGFLRSCAEFPKRCAVDVGGRETTYGELGDRAKSLAATIQAGSPADGLPLTAIFAYRSQTAYAGVLGALMAGHGYVPLNRTFPVERSRLMLERSMCRSLIVDRESEAQLGELLSGADQPLLLICPDRTDVAELAASFPRHRVIGENDFAQADEWRLTNPPANSIAYLLFTSGSTGQPKGVMVSHENVLSYLDYVIPRYGINEQDRCSQTFDMTFDLSAHDLFVAWETGACVCCPSQKQLFKPDRFINESRLTTWFSVPSTAIFMRRLGLLKPASYPRLRLSLFCGEALPVQTVIDWSAAAPNSIVENIYGPTELTIACAAYRWDPERSPEECEQGTVPIGEPFERMEALIADSELHEVPLGHDGELLMTGPQLTLGYWTDEEKTRRAFVVPPGEDRVFYRTGDRVRRSGKGKPIVYLGRIDNQVKILGHRVELGEIESRIRDASGLEGVVAIGWPATPSGADAVEAFLEAEAFDTDGLLATMKAELPPYMVPRTVRLLKRFPLNANGKYDRAALTQILEAKP